MFREPPRNCDYRYRGILRLVSFNILNSWKLIYTDRAHTQSNWKWGKIIKKPVSSFFDETIDVTSLGNMLICKSAIRAGEETIRAGHGRVRAGENFNSPSSLNYFKNKNMISKQAYI